ncbi:bifunctional [glutamate--ammonia ligase]-adenylyl-L-tyrosine phosphorylase/[glutamate--ammonia-ligase] adenylyltransferase [Zhongshania aliphaticivorans]|uniref:bifunctional [glutamate--ammonia ligase]-adenylyl-L-tyrosine phosphorylase/[glutamate--ammonia-ligase] adenylyltransferase n=1 Tax=Zhongshania aliphaticivorans TaxID=1470434 RepID=UPI0012E4EA89|nr:bifunctional [glutamate--ammonia ligase]-adenylyl-L-tyrosine phosphorylase/[glutamate--ammonia-ligase] adenylyltransferase [Zhongshania aliphaticivorans]CAA0117623.1 Bifunctional glutamine synthetase adenylyltransferase/adenylyl-removing enzyme [Zhongshania aliphaticivorans]
MMAPSRHRSLDILEAELPAILASEVERYWQRLLDRCDADQRAWYSAFAESDQRQYLLTAFAGSPALADLCERHPTWLPDLFANNALSACLPDKAWIEELGVSCAECVNADDLAKALRDFRNRHWLRIVWRDLNRLAAMEETVRDLSALADACVEVALAFLHKQLVVERGEPRSADGTPQQLVVIAMGKLGAGELNLSSDIDLIFAYPEAGNTVGAARSDDNQAFFIRLGQRLIKALDARTADGFVFRVDMRLRPYGQSGPLVISFDALEEYYQDQGRDWERYALIKARCIAGDRREGERLLTQLRPFVYRRYLDFSAIESLRDMKSMIQREVARRHLQDNIKLGSGGIREIEFIAQCFQLIRGGQEPALQALQLQTILPELAQMAYLPESVVDDLQEAYRFLRNTEHAIQAWRDEQTQQLPDADPARVALSFTMGFGDDVAAFLSALEQHRQGVATHFANVIAPPETEPDGQHLSNNRWRTMLDELDKDSVRQTLEEAGFDDADEAARLLVALLSGASVLRMQGSGRDRLYDFLPLILEDLCDAESPAATLLRLIPLIEAVLRRTAYLVLLIENPGARKRLVELCDASPWIARQLAAQPVLLDELLDANSLFSVPEKAGLASELRQRLLRIENNDLEAQMEALRYFRLAHVLKIAASEVTGSLPLMKVSDYLTYIAEVVLDAVLDIAWQNLIDKHGSPVPAGDDQRHFVILGYGKLGGLELGYGSDLDLVFLHDLPSTNVSDGERPLDAGTFFTRLGQRIIHILTATTRLGDLYEVDMRLRPSGNSGLLVSSFTAFSDYQHTQAWTWEHQALVRVRAVAGDDNLAQKFVDLRAGILSKSRDILVLKAEVVAMRQKMRDHLLSASNKNAEFDIKQGTGGIVDIEFMVQYAVLAWSQQHPPLTYYTDNIRILESLSEQGLISAADTRTLIDAYKAFRSQAHRLSLQEQKGLIAETALGTEREIVSRFWQQLMLSP